MFDAAKIEKVAVVVADATGKLTGPVAGPLRAMEDEFLQSLVQSGYRVVDRSQTESLVKEIRFQRASGYTEADAAELGRMLNASCVLLVSLTDVSVTAEETGWVVNRRRVVAISSVASVGARMIDVETAEVLWVGSVTDRCSISDPRAEATAAAGVAARTLASSLPARREALVSTASMQQAGTTTAVTKQ